MNIDHIKLPPVSKNFYNRLLLAFPPLNPLDIKKNTDMIDIHRNAAQQEVIHFISKAVKKEPTVQRMTVWEKIMYVLK